MNIIIVIVETYSNGRYKNHNFHSTKKLLERMDFEPSEKYTSLSCYKETVFFSINHHFVKNSLRKNEYLANIHGFTAKLDGNYRFSERS